MSDFDSNEGPKDSFFWKLFNLQPAVWRGLVTAVFALLAAIGIKVAADVPDVVFLVVLALLPILQGVWTKGAVTPNAKVVVKVDDPIDAPNDISAGEAVVPIDTDKFGSEAQVNNLVELAGTRGIQ